MRHGRAIAAGFLAAAALATATSPAEGKTTLQRQVDQVLRHAAPGARQIAPNRVTWPRRGVTVTLSAPGMARAAAPLDCRVGYACLWQDANATSRRVDFFRYGAYNLAAYGMPPGTRRGASSYFNRQTEGAHAYLSGFAFLYEMLEYGNVPRNLNDRARTIRLTRPWSRDVVNG